LFANSIQQFEQEPGPHRQSGHPENGARILAKPGSFPSHYLKRPRNDNLQIMKLKVINPFIAALLLISLSPVLTVNAGGDLRAEAETAIKNLQSADSTLTNLFSSSAGYAVFPKVGKAGFIFGAEHGDGIVYEEGKPSGEATLSEINVGPQVGGESFYEVIFFQTTEALANFKEGHFEMSAKAGAVAAAEGAALNAKYREGVLVFTLPRSGLMVQVAIGGQKFTFKPLK
jgi:lipid-binding SYLF domain-containing protein